jgi:cysteinyl-tRNA synthetase
MSRVAPGRNRAGAADRAYSDDVLRVTDTLTGARQPVRPAGGGLLRIYACGPTVYRRAHVGNLRTFLLTDLVRREAEAGHGQTALVVQNITDVGHLVDDSAVDPDGEDKVLAAARAEGKPVAELTAHYETLFHADCAALNILPADAYPRASASIPLMIDLVDRLLAAGHAYRGSDGSVYFDARSYPGYGALSGNRLAALRPGHRQQAGALAAGKRFHADWALWKVAGPRRIMTWDSPWGPGYPGWHVECSAMSLHHLGDTIDVHTGGGDLRFPHHEDERAQSDAAAGRPVVRTWLHGGHVLAAGRKMAKSRGNVVVLEDVVARGHDPLALRLLFLGSRYRQQLDLTWAALDAAGTALRRWRERVARWAETPSAAPSRGHLTAIRAALDDDLDTPGALAALARLAQDPGLPDGAKFETAAAADRVLGLDLVRDVGRAPARGAELPGGAADLLAQRATARSSGDFATADRLREHLGTLGVRVDDSPSGQVWKVGVPADPR